ncbi:hypothetical protein HID58_000040, partial [Brassica napus]
RCPCFYHGLKQQCLYLYCCARRLEGWWGTFSSSSIFVVSALFQRVGSGGASGARSEIGDLLTVRFEWCLGSSSRDQEFSFSHLQFVSTLLSSSIWLPCCSPTVLILSGLWVWVFKAFIQQRVKIIAWIFLLVYSL